MPAGARLVGWISCFVGLGQLGFGFGLRLRHGHLLHPVLVCVACGPPQGARPGSDSGSGSGDSFDH
eukprot:COSAG01_NODE_13637_length_1555_cov_1.282280_1_plen_65_part_10